MAGWDTVNANGTPMYRKMRGWYKVNPQDCSGTMVVRDDTGVDPDFQITFYIGEEGKTVYAVNVNNLESPGVAPLFVMPIPMEHVNVPGEH